MKLRGTFLNHAGIQVVNLPRVVSEAFDLSMKDARRALDDDEVLVDGKPTDAIDIPVSELAGRELQLERQVVSIV